MIKNVSIIIDIFKINFKLGIAAEKNYQPSKHDTYNFKNEV